MGAKFPVAGDVDRTVLPQPQILQDRGVGGPVSIKQSHRDTGCVDAASDVDTGVVIENPHRCGVYGNERHVPLRREGGFLAKGQYGVSGKLQRGVAAFQDDSSVGAKHVGGAAKGKAITAEEVEPALRR